MDVRRLGEAGLHGWRRKVGDRVAQLVSRRTPLDADAVRALAGAVFFVLSARYVVNTVRRASRREA